MTFHIQASHVMAMALQKLFPEAQTTIGPWIERGFYYDFDLPTPLTPADLKAVKREMVKIIKADLPFVCEEVRSQKQSWRSAAGSFAAIGYWRLAGCWPSPARRRALLSAGYSAWG